MAFWNHYLQPTTVEEAIDDLCSSNGSAVVIAGGTDILLDIRQGRHSSVDAMVDVTSIDEMRQIHVGEDGIFLGAAVTHKAILDSPVLRDNATCLVEGCGLIGGPQVRNVATIGGNVAHALPAGDGTIGLLALDAQAQVASAEGRRWQPLGELFVGPGQTSFDRASELLVGFKLPLRQPGETSAFRRIMRPQGVAIAILNMAGWMRLSPDRTIEDVRIAVGPSGPRPFRAAATEKTLRGSSLDDETIRRGVEMLLSEVSLRTSRHRATEEYRRHLIAVLLERTLLAAERGLVEQEVTS